MIADYRLQDGRTGTEAILAVRALFDHPIPGLILTGETDPKFLRECTGHDVGIAHKPVMPSQLGRALDQQVRGPSDRRSPHPPRSSSDEGSDLGNCEGESTPSLE